MSALGNYPNYSLPLRILSSEQPNCKMTLTFVSVIFIRSFFSIFLINFGFKRNDYRLLISDASEQHHNDFNAYQETTAAYKPTETTTRSYEALLEAAYRARFSKCCHDYDLKDCIPGQCGIFKQICCF